MTRTKRSQPIRAAVASTIGTTIEWYDFFIYGTAAALVFPKLFFPGSSPFMGQLASFATMFVGFIARPLGGAIFGHFGDRAGRKSTLVITLLLTGSATALIGVLPGYRTLGAAAPALLILLRMVQGVAVGGEWAGSVTMSMEWASPKRRGLMAAWPQMGVPLGMLLSLFATTYASATTGGAFLAWGWRIPFLGSVLLIAVGLYVRLRVTESPEFSQVQRQRTVSRQPVWEALRRQPRQVLTSAFIRVGEQAPYYLFSTFVLSYGTGHLGMDRGDLLDALIIASTIGLVTVPLAGYLSDLFGRRTVYAAGLVGTGVFAFPYFGLVDTTNARLVVLAMAVALFFHDLQYGSQAALIAEGFDTRLRSSGGGLGYQLGSVVAGGPAPLIAAALLQRTGSSTAISAYIVVCSAISLAALALMPRADRVIDSQSHDRAVVVADTTTL